MSARKRPRRSPGVEDNARAEAYKLVVLEAARTCGPGVVAYLEQVGPWELLAYGQAASLIDPDRGCLDPADLADFHQRNPYPGRVPIKAVPACCGLASGCAQCRPEAWC